MLVLPSVGATVRKIILNESATKAKIFYDDGSTTIVSTKNTPNTSAVKKTTLAPNGGISKKKIIKKTPTGTTKVITKSSIMNMESVAPNVMAQRVPAVIERAKRRAELLEQQTMDAGAVAAMAMQDGQEIT